MGANDMAPLNIPPSWDWVADGIVHVSRSSSWSSTGRSGAATQRVGPRWYPTLRPTGHGAGISSKPVTPLPPAEYRFGLALVGIVDVHGRRRHGVSSATGSRHPGGPVPPPSTSASVSAPLLSVLQAPPNQPPRIRTFEHSAQGVWQWRSVLVPVQELDGDPEALRWSRR